MQFFQLMQVVVPADVNYSPFFRPDEVGNFFICLVAGILLAAAFQFLLTNLGVALGISAIGDIRDTDNNSNSSSSSDSSTPTGVKITSGLGVALTLSMAVSLFFASLVAVKLTLTPNNNVGFAMGLVIWAGYLLLSFYFEGRMVSSLIGSVFSAVRSALSAGADVVGSGAKAAAHETAHTLVDEVRQEFDFSSIEDKLDKYVQKLQPQKPSLDNIQDHLADLIHQIEIREKYTPNDPTATKKLFLEIADKQPNLSAADKEKLSSAFDKVKASLQTEGSKLDKATAAFDKFSPGDDAKGEEIRQKVGDYLKKTDLDELDPQALQSDLERLLDDPKATGDIIKQRLSHFDRNTLVGLLAARSDMDEEKAEKYLNKAETVFNTIKGKVEQTLGAASDKKDEMVGDAKASVNQATGNDVEDLDVTLGDTRYAAERTKAESAVAEWFNRMNRPELRYDRLRTDMQRILDDPKAAPGVLKNRLSRLDSDSIKALLTNNNLVDESQIDKAVAEVEHARDEVVRKANEIEMKIKLKLDEAKEEALAQAEGVRKTAASAAWWLFIASVVSAIASAVGGILAYTW